MAGVSFEIKGLNRVKLKFDKTARNLRNPSQPMEIIAQMGRRNVIEHFDRSEGPGGTRWKRLKSRAGRPLIDTGRLKGSIMSFVQKSIATITTNVNYASFHNSGTSRIPKRKFMWISKKTIKTMVKVLQAYSIGAFK